VTRTEEEGPWIQCGDGYSKISLSDIPDIQSWMHLSYTTDLNESKSYLSINELAYEGDFAPMKDRRAYYAAGMDL